MAARLQARLCGLSLQPVGCTPVTQSATAAAVRGLWRYKNVGPLPFTAVRDSGANQSWPWVCFFHWPNSSDRITDTTQPNPLPGELKYPVSNPTHAQPSPSYISNNGWLAIRVMHRTAKRICPSTILDTQLHDLHFSHICHFRPMTQPNPTCGLTRSMDNCCTEQHRHTWT